MSKDKAPRKLIEVTLAKPHTHAGRKCQPGEKISVSGPVRDWLIKHKIIDTPAAATKETK